MPKKVALGINRTAGVPAAVVLSLLNLPAARAQSSVGSKPAFEVASIRHCEMGAQNGVRGDGWSPGRFSSGCSPLVSFVRFAYIQYANGQSQSSFSTSAKIVGAPAWAISDGYEIDAKAQGNPSRGVVLGPMLQALLEDRFNLKIHRETRQIPVYNLIVAKSGPKLRRFQQGSCVPRSQSASPLKPGQNFCGPSPFTRKGALLVQELHGVSVGDFANILDGIMDRPVIDKTGIPGQFDFSLEFEPEQQTMRVGLPPPPPGDAQENNGAPATTTSFQGPSIFTALEEQLGLKLDLAKGPGEFFVIDHVDRPSEN